MTEPYFLDCSHWNGVIDWARVRAAGITHAYIKASESTNYTDPAFKTNWTGAKASGIKRGAYMFFRGNAGGAAQAQHFLKVVGPDLGEIDPAVDVEAAASGISKAQYTIRLRDCLLELETVKKPVIYTSAVKMQELTTQPAWIAEYKLWLAAPDAPVPPLPAGATEWWLHQYSWTGTVDGIEGAVDLDHENVVVPPNTTPPADTDARAIRAHAEAITGLAV